MEWGHNPQFNARAEEDSYAPKVVESKLDAGEPLHALVKRWVSILPESEYLLDGYPDFDNGDTFLLDYDASAQQYVLPNGQRLHFSHFSVAQAPAPVQSPVAGRKDDSGKLDMTLLDDMPRALAAVVEVMQWAITKKQPMPYERSSWLGVIPDRYRAAILRHNNDAASQSSVTGLPVRFQTDIETGLLHLAHQACSAMMALENTLREIESRGG